MRGENNLPNDFLIGRWLTGDLSAEEQKELSEWVALSGENQKFLEDAKEIQDGIEHLELMKSIDTASALDTVKSKIGQKINRVKQFFLYAQRVAAILILPLIASTIYMYMANVAEQEATASLPWVEVSTPVGLRSVFSLPDGSKVWLNSSTTLRYPPNFSKEERLVKLDGEAYFDVTTNPQRPFIVDAGKMQIEAVGTSFNVMAYNEDNLIEAALVEGKVNILREVKGKRHKVTDLLPGQLAVFQKAENKIKRSQRDLDKHIAWREGKIVFKNDPLDDMLRKLSHWYNVDFEIDPKMKRDYAYTGSFVGEDLYQILKYIELTTPIQFKVSKPEQGVDTVFKKRVIFVKQKKR